MGKEHVQVVEEIAQGAEEDDLVCCEDKSQQVVDAFVRACSQGRRHSPHRHGFIGNYRNLR